MRWTVLVPVKPAGRRKERLAARLSAEARHTLVDAMLARVLDAIGQVPRASVRVVTAVPLNPALMAERAALEGQGVAVVHADLPLVGANDIAALLDAAERGGMAIAPDRHGRGTNALAIADDRRFAFAFGIDSFARHRVQAPDAAIVECRGLAFDLDEPADLAFLAGDAEAVSGQPFDESITRRKI